MITGYDKMPFAMYQRLMAITEQYENESERNLAIIAELSGESEEYLLDLPLDEFNRYVKGASFLLHAPKLPKIRSEYKVGKFTLVPTIKTSQMTAGQYIDFQTYAKEGDSRIIEMLSCLLVPKGHKYNNGYDVEEVQRACKDHLSTLEIVALISFFSACSVKSIAHSLSCLGLRMPRAERRTMRESKKKVMRFLTNGDGLQSLMQFLKLPEHLGSK